MDYNVRSAERAAANLVSRRKLLRFGRYCNAPSDNIVVFSTRIEALKAMQNLYIGDIYQGSTTIQERNRMVASDVLFRTTICPEASL